MQVSIVESLDSDRAADIVEEMNPDAAADLLADLTQARSEEILEEMAPEERHDVEGLLEHRENTAGGRMTTDFLSFSQRATVADAIDGLREFDGGTETLSTLFLVDKDEKLVGTVPLASIVATSYGWQAVFVIAVALNATRMLSLDEDRVNVNGGAVALGHPIGASGARILVTLLYELQRRNLKRGIAALCLGGGNAVALAVERF